MTGGPQSTDIDWAYVKRLELEHLIYWAKASREQRTNTRNTWPTLDDVAEARAVARRLKMSVC